MQRSIILGLIIALILSVFAIYNAHDVKIDFFFGEPLEGPLSLILLITIIAGVVLGIIFSFPSINKQTRIIQRKNKEIEKLEGLLERYRKETGRTKEQDEGKQSKKH
ncbi:MAG: LapA family protein [Bacteroidales bacterium]|nr:LapA family protein [Bacteroidales bacterium]